MKGKLLTAEEIKNEIRTTLDGVRRVSEQTSEGDLDRVLDESFSVLWPNEDVGDISRIPLEPDLVAYCFSEVLGFTDRRQIAEKVDYIIPFDYKGTYAVVSHCKLSYELKMIHLHIQEFLKSLETVRALIEKLFILIAEDSLSKDEFSMKNEAPRYLQRIEFYQNRITNLQAEKDRIQKESEGLYDIVQHKNRKTITPRNHKRIIELSNEIQYDIDAYIDIFYAAIEHIPTILFPLVTAPSGSFYSNYLRQTRWTWKRKIESVCGDSISPDIIEQLSMVKEVYRNNKAHGSFSREMMAYISIPHFGRYPVYIGKTYLKGFLDDDDIELSYEKYLDIKETFCSFIDMLDSTFPIPMMLVRSGLPISADTNTNMQGISSVSDPQDYIDRHWYEIDNQVNMDW